MSDDENTVTIADVEVLLETEKAVFCHIYDDDFWIPKSVIKEDSECQGLYDKGFLSIDRWWAEKEGLD